jgi:hypothetical protein
VISWNGTHVHFPGLLVGAKRLNGNQAKFFLGGVRRRSEPAPPTTVSYGTGSDITPLRSFLLKARAAS